MRAFLLIGKQRLAVLRAKVLTSKAKGRPFHCGRNGGDRGSFLEEGVTLIGRGTAGTNCTKIAFSGGACLAGRGDAAGQGGDWRKEQKRACTFDDISVLRLKWRRSDTFFLVTSARSKHFFQARLLPALASGARAQPVWATWTSLQPPPPRRPRARSYRARTPHVPARPSVTGLAARFLSRTSAHMLQA